MLDLRERFGICQWIDFENRRLLESTIRILSDVGVDHLRTGISWADNYTPGGRRWYDYLTDALEENPLEVLYCVHFTPPSISMDPSLGSCAVPPAQERALADFLSQLMERYEFLALEIWNEPNSDLFWRSSRLILTTSI